MISKRELSKQIEVEINSSMLSLGFERKNSLQYECSRSGTQKIVGIILRHAFDGSWRLQIGARVRFPEIELLKSLGENNSTKSGTYGGLLHLINDRPFHELKFEESERLSSVAANILSMIIDEAIPFLDKYQDMNEVDEKLESEEPSDWLTYSIQGRTITLAAMLCVQGSEKEARKLLERYILSSAEKHPKYYGDAKDMLEYICST